MVLVSRKKYNKLKEELSSAQIEIDGLKDSLECEKNKNYKILEDKTTKENNYLEQIKTMEDIERKNVELINSERKLNKKKDSKISELERKLRLSNSARGGMQRAINTLTKKLEEYQKNENLFKVKKIKSCKGTTQKMKVPKVQISSVRNTLKEISKVREHEEH